MTYDDTNVIDRLDTLEQMKVGVSSSRSQVVFHL